MLIENELSANLIKILRVHLFEIFRITGENLILSNNYVATPASGLNEQYLPAYARWRGTSAPEAARAAVTVLFTINRPIIGRLHADPFGDTKSRCRRLVINHASSPSSSKSRLHAFIASAKRNFLRFRQRNCASGFKSRRLDGDLSLAKSECTWRARAQLPVPRNAKGKKKEKKKRANSTPTWPLGKPRNSRSRDASGISVAQLQLRCRNWLRIGRTPTRRDSRRRIASYDGDSAWQRH